MKYEEKFMNVKNKHKNRKPGTKISNFWMNQQQIDLYIENFRIDNFNEYALRPNVAIFIDFLSSIFEKAQKNLFSDRLYKFMKNITNMLTSFLLGDILWLEMKEFHNQNWEISRTDDKYFEEKENTFKFYHKMTFYVLDSNKNILLTNLKKILIF